MNLEITESQNWQLSLLRQFVAGREYYDSNHSRMLWQFGSGQGMYDSFIRLYATSGH